jgi:D-sedoheptulose 7-phosphate isomerase
MVSFMKAETKQYLESFFARYPLLQSERPSIERALQLLLTSYQNGGKLLVCGNGGSAADSLHIVGELMKGFMKERSLPAEIQKKLCASAPEDGQYIVSNLQQGFPAVSLVSEIGLNTAFVNDKQADLVFAQQVMTLGKKGDVLLAISTSGNSKNCIFAAEVARFLHLSTIGLTGANGGKLRGLCDVSICAPSQKVYEIQEFHLPIYHLLCLCVESELI